MAGGTVSITARARQAWAARPGCETRSWRVHSSYQRRLLDTAAAGREVVISLEVRRFFCAAAECRKVTFAELVSGLTSRHARRTPAADAVLQAVALALGGRPGARLARRLSCAVSRSTLLRFIRAAADPADHAPRVLGRLRAPQGTRLRHHPDRRRDPPAGRHPARAIGGSSMRTFPRARCGWSGRPANRSRRSRVTSGSTRARWATGLPPAR